MRGAVTLLICASAFVLGAARNSRCPENLAENLLLPHGRCNRFYQCVAGELVAQRCAADLKFNIDTQLCDWDYNVVCGDRDDNESEEIIEDFPENPNVNDNPSLAPIICAAEGSDGILVAHEYCNKFYICTAGTRVTMRCPGNLLYNPFKLQCDWPENVRCRNRLPEGDSGNNNDDDDSHPGNDDPSLAPVICAAENSDGVMVANEYCNKFYKCSSGIRIILTCPPGLLFNPRRDQCDWPSNVNCGRRIVPDPSNDIEGIDGSVNNDGNTGNSKGGNDNPSEAPAICGAASSDGILVAHEQCNKFYKCANGIPVALKCQLNLLYEPSKEQCDWPDNVDCGNREVPENDSNENSDNENIEDNENDDGGNDNPSEAPAICAAEGSDGVLVAHEYCNRFYKCSRGLPAAMSCPSPLLYNPPYKYCDWPVNVDCGDRIN